MTGSGADDMRVLLTVPTLERGGAERMVVELAKGLAGREIACAVCYLDGQGTLAPEIREAGVPVHCLELPHKAWPGRARMAGVLREFRPTVIHAHMPRAAVWSAAAKSSRVPLVYTEHNMQELYPGYCAWFYQYFLPRTARVIAVSSDAAASFSRRWPAHSRKVSVIQTGVPLEDVRAEQDPRQVRERHGIGDEPLICAVGAVRPSKAYHYLARAVCTLCGSGVDVRALIVGTKDIVPAEAARVEQEIRELKVEDRVQLVGEVENAYDYIVAADMLVLSSVQEGLPRVILEAMAAGKPVVTPDVGGCAEAVVNGETGLVVPAHDPEALGAAITYLVEYPEEARRMGETGRKRAQEMFTIEAMIRKHVDTYEGLESPGTGRA